MQGSAQVNVMRNWQSFFFMVTCPPLALACAAGKAETAPRLTSGTVLTTALGQTQAERALHNGDVPGALAAADRDTSMTPDEPWAHYDRAVVLAEVGRTSDALKEFVAAESHFAGRSAWGEAVCIYGRAHALASVGQCSAAKVVFAQYAAFVRGAAPEKADMALRYADDCVPSRTIDPAERIASAVVAGDYSGALALAPAGDSAWLDYDRAVALGALRRTDEAVASYRSAERAFGDDQRGNRSLAIYGRAEVLAGAARCSEAKQAFAEYATLVRSANPHDAQIALIHADECLGPYGW